MPNGMLVADGAQQLLADDHRHFSPAGDVHRSVLENPRRSEDRVLTAACAAADSVCMHELVAAGSKLGPRRVICRWPVRRNLQILGKQRARPRWSRLFFTSSVVVVVGSSLVVVVAASPSCKKMLASLSLMAWCMVGR